MCSLQKMLDLKDRKQLLKSASELYVAAGIEDNFLIFSPRKAVPYG
jgi:hypothetical protein